MDINTILTIIGITFYFLALGIIIHAQKGK